jgi:hypothetical protein
VKEVIKREGLVRLKQSVIAVHDSFAELIKLHTFGDYFGCTNYCWTQMLYQYIYLRMKEMLKIKLEEIIL